MKVESSCHFCGESESRLTAEVIHNYVVVEIEEMDDGLHQAVHCTLSPDQARELGESLIEMAHNAGMLRA